MTLKTIDRSGQISLDERHAGKIAMVEEIEPGVWVIQLGRGALRGAEARPPTHQTALEAMGDLYRILPEAAAKHWIEESRELSGTLEELRDPWDS